MIGRTSIGVGLAALVAAQPALAHGDEVPVSRLGSAWTAAPTILVGAGVALLLFAAFLRLRRRGRADHARSRPVLFLLAVAIGTLALVSPLDEVGDSYLMSGHMLQHVLIGDVAPALALVALRGPLLFFVLPHALLRSVARLQWFRRLLAVLLEPLVSFAVWIAVVAAWHMPAAYDYTLGHQTIHDLEHLSFILSGLVWMQITDPAPTPVARLAALRLHARSPRGGRRCRVLAFSSTPPYRSTAQDERPSASHPSAISSWPES